MTASIMAYPHICAFVVGFMCGVTVSCCCYYLVGDEQGEPEEQNEVVDNKLAVEFFVLYLLLKNRVLLPLLHWRGQG